MSKKKKDKKKPDSQGCSGQMYPDGNNNGAETCCSNTEFIKEYDWGENVCCPNSTDVAGLNIDLIGKKGEDQYLCCGKDSTKQDPVFGPVCCPKGKNIQKGQQGSYICCSNPSTEDDSGECVPLNCKNVYRNNKGVNTCCDDPKCTIVGKTGDPQYCCKKGYITAANLNSLANDPSQPPIICADPTNCTPNMSGWTVACCPDGSKVTMKGISPVEGYACCPGKDCPKGNEGKK